MNGIKQARLAAGLTQHQAAEEIFHVTPKTYIGWEKGYVELKPYHKAAIIRELNEYEERG